MKTVRPYLLRAFYEWILDNGYTPYILVDAEQDNVMVPAQYVQNGQIVLNVSPLAADKLVINNEYIEFNARFSGVLNRIFLPVFSILAIYAKENGKGIRFSLLDIESEDEWFEDRDFISPVPNPDFMQKSSTFSTVSNNSNSNKKLKAGSKDGKRPSLTLIKGGADNSKKNNDDDLDK